MFAGSVPRIVARLADEHYRGFSASRVFVACSGAFTVERHLRSIGGWSEIHSNDVILVSQALGRYSMGDPMKLELTDLGRERIGWIEPYLTDPRSALAALACAAQFSMAIRDMDDAEFYRRTLRETERQWPKMFPKTLAVMDRWDLKINSYTAGDVFDYLGQAGGDDAVISYPPFRGPRKAAARYAQDYAALHPLFVWDEPAYTMLTDDNLDRLYQLIADRRDWLFAVNQRLDGWDDLHRATASTSNRGTTFEIYASNGPTRFVGPHQVVSPVNTPHIGPGDRITEGDQLTLHPVDSNQFSLLRSAYMNKGIRPGNPDLMVAVCVGGKLIGAFAYQFASTFASWEKWLPGPHAYLMSDFPVKHSDYDRLAKLIVLASVSKEAQELCLRRGRKPYRSMTTTAFSNNPTSMKYRGVLTLIRRRPNDIMKTASFAHLIAGDAYYQRPWDLQYGRRLGQHTLQEALAHWLANHSKLKAGVAA